MLLIPMKTDASGLLQIWELHSNGTLENSYSGLCATVKFVEGEIL